VFFILNLSFANTIVAKSFKIVLFVVVIFIIADDFYLSNCCIVNFERKFYELES